ncbi:MAG TPA: PHP domain-containing protein [Acidimicrobiales bacterium]|nr:PHP domain-containing protein [Acidimicrobiales bacterium]
MLDLHTHSSFSDGSDTPLELARAASAVGLRAIALTDHDTTLSYPDMRLACDEWGVELVSGVEVSLRDNAFPLASGAHEGARNVHLLAYFVPLEATHPLQQELARLRQDREERNLALVQLLNERGFDRITLHYLVTLAGGPESIGRPHFARAMFELHPEIVGERTEESWNRVFVEWLGHTGKAYLPKTSMPLERFVDAGRGAGVVFSIAHPLVNYLDQGASSIERTMPAVLHSLRERGVHGVEAYYGSSDAATRALMVKLTRDAGMIPTGGSDYHGAYKPEVRLGRGRSGDLLVPDEILDEMKAAR